MSINTFSDCKLVGPCGFYHVVLKHDDVRWELLLLADVHQDPDAFSRRSKQTGDNSVSAFITNRMVRGTCLDIFMEQRHNQLASCTGPPTGHMSVARCAIQARCQQLYDDSHPLHCIDTDRNVRVHALDFRTVDGIPVYMDRVHKNKLSPVPVSLSPMWKSFANAVVLGSIQPVHTLWYTCSDAGCLTDYYSMILSRLHRQFKASIFCANPARFEAVLFECLKLFYTGITPDNLDQMLHSSILSLDARLFDLSYLFGMFTTDAYAVNCRSGHRNVIMYAGYQHIQFIQLLIKRLLLDGIKTEDAELLTTPVFNISPAMIASGNGSKFVVKLIREPFRD